MAGRQSQVGVVLGVALWAAAAANAQEDGGVAAAAVVPALAQEDGGVSVTAPGADAADAGYTDATDLFLSVGWGEKEQVRPQPFKLYPSILPAVGYSPSVGALLGVVGQFGMYLGDPANTTISSAQATLLFTTKKQVLFQIFSSVQTEDDLWQLIGDWRLLLYNQDTFGLGTGTPPVHNGFTLGGQGATAPLPGEQPMNFKLIRFREVVLRRVWSELSVGGGFSYDRYYDIIDHSLDLTASPPVVTSHYAYETALGLPTGAYTASGPVVAVSWDSRDSTINAYRGVYALLSYQWNGEWAGSTRSSSLINGEFRAYLPLSKDVSRNVLAFWVLASAVIGDMPYLTLPSIGWDGRNRSGRGYLQGRYRGTAMAYGETEWRFRITDNGLLGGVIFANVESFASPNIMTNGINQPGESLFHSARWGGGFGLRILMNRVSRTNITLDFAWGAGLFGIYFGAGEVF
jgi:hypothetical protein